MLHLEKIIKGNAISLSVAICEQRGQLKCFCKNLKDFFYAGNNFLNVSSTNNILIVLGSYYFHIKQGDCIFL